MSLLHVLLAVRLALGRVGAGRELALVHGRRRRVFVIDVTITFLLRWPAHFVVAAFQLWALPRTRVRLLVLGQVARALELLVADMARVHDVSGSIGLATASHGAIGLVFIIFIVGEGALQHHGVLVEGAVVRKGNDLPIPVPDKLGGLAVLAQAAFED